jgi:hypothetical protein
MPKVDGITATGRMCERCFDVHILVLTTCGADADIGETI